ncbi:MAG: OmpA family protein [Gemmatimonadales bacterium]
MTYSRLTSMTMMLVATVGITSPAPRAIHAQTPTDSTAAPDSAAPKKSRFGGLMNKAKSVAGNKAVQGAAKGVACTVVPGGAVSAATGTGPCANSGLVAGLAGGLRGAAANGAMGVAANVTGLSNVAAQAAALQLIRGAGASGINNASAQAAALQLMQQNGMSNAAAAAGLAKMMKAQAGAGAGTAADAAAAMQMMQAMGLMNAAASAVGGNVRLAAAPGGTTGAASVAAPAAVYVNYDFVPGDRVIYYQDFTDDQVGNFPARLNFVEGNMEVAELGGRRVMRATSSSKLSIPLPEALPDKFTIEIDVINRPTLAGADFHLRGSVGRVDDAGTTIIGWGSDGVSLAGGGGGEVKLAGDSYRARYTGKPAQVRILGDGKYIKVYLDEKRLANVPNANFQHSKVLHLFIDGRSEENPAYVTRIRVAESHKAIYDDIVSSGRVITQGLLFDTGSDQLKPESAPTLREISGMMTQHPELKLRIEGHTDNVGAKDANRALSDKRAASVKAALVSQYHIDAKRLDSKGFGDTKPLGPNTSAEGRATNRRVELVKM